MAVDSISPIMAPSALTNLSRPQQATPTAQESAAQQNDARLQTVNSVPASSQVRPQENTAPAGSVHVVPTADVAATLSEATTQIARASSGSDTSSALRSASEAYQSEANAGEAALRQQQNNSSSSVNVLA